jgi:predicted DNA-binding transcriptional regulator YafY
MTESSSRLLELLSLLQARQDWPGGELADRLGVSCRTIRRDVERLRELGYPVDSLTGPAGGYRLRAGTAMPPLLLDDEEAIAIAVGLRTAARASVTSLECACRKVASQSPRSAASNADRSISISARPIFGESMSPQRHARESGFLRGVAFSRIAALETRHVQLL